ncbi:MAG: Flp1 family type IVb pilin [Bdellovibrionales bacterium]
MKNKINKLYHNAREIFAKIINDESGQGMTEYILLVVVVIAIAALFKDKIKTAIEGQMTTLSGLIGGFTGN